MEILGVTGMGGRVPIVIPSGVRRLDAAEQRGEPALEPTVHLLEDVWSTALDSQWIQLTGTVRRAESRNELLVLEFGPLRTRRRAFIPKDAAFRSETDWGRSRIRVTGVLTEQADPAGQMLSRSVYGATSDDLQRVASEVEDPWAGAWTLVRQATVIAAESRLESWVRIRGQVTAVPTPERFCLQDDSGGMTVLAQRPGPVQLGDTIEACGCLAPGEDLPRLEDAHVRVLAGGPPLRAQALRSIPSPSTGWQRRLATLEGRLVQTLHAAGSPVLIVGAGGAVIHAALARLLPDSRLELTGIWLGSTLADPEAAHRLWLRTPGDVRVVRLPAWWTPGRLLTIWGGVAGSGLLVLVWALTLRRQVERHRVLQILVNLIRNAKYALEDVSPTNRWLTVRVRLHDGSLVRIEVADNGVGIPPENLVRIFTHGFTTRKDGHGFGLHSGSLAAKELAGSLTAQSPGLHQGATFTLELPVADRRDDPTEPGSAPT